jgi:hypothetical protein
VHLKNQGQITMLKKCKANCQANDNLYLRGDVFYYMVELPHQDCKRRYFIKSLHTKRLLKRAKELMTQVKFDTVDVNVDNGNGQPFLAFV